jgi:hypothetical protein
LDNKDFESKNIRAQWYYHFSLLKEAKMLEAFVISLAGYGMIIGTAQTLHFIHKLRLRK